MYIVGIADAPKHIRAAFGLNYIHIGCIKLSSTEWKVVSTDAKVIGFLETDVKFTKIANTAASEQGAGFTFSGDRAAVLNALIGTVGNISRIVDLPFVE